MAARGPVCTSFRRDLAAAFVRNGERSVAGARLAPARDRMHEATLRLVSAQGLARPAVLLQICVKCRLLEFSEKPRLIRIEYGQKACDLTNRRFRPCC
jgi:hypothetical protein